MSVAAGGGGESAIDPKKTAALGIIGGFLGIYLTPLILQLGLF
jgi:tetrahydromethanopterin S-methyltransferase subunit C